MSRSAQETYEAALAQVRALRSDHKDPREHSFKIDPEEQANLRLEGENLFYRENLSTGEATLCGMKVEVSW